MSKLKQRVTLETAFGSYVVNELIGEGGAGRVYGGIGSDSVPIAVKVLATERASSEKKGRFKNEIAFLARNKHANIVTVIDHGVANARGITGPFYVMRSYDGNLRDLIRGKLRPDAVLPLFRSSVLSPGQPMLAWWSALPPWARNRALETAQGLGMAKQISLKIECSAILFSETAARLR